MIRLMCSDPPRRRVLSQDIDPINRDPIYDALVEYDAGLVQTVWDSIQNAMRDEPEQERIALACGFKVYACMLAYEAAGGNAREAARSVIVVPVPTPHRFAGVRAYFDPHRPDWEIRVVSSGARFEEEIRSRSKVPR